MASRGVTAIQKTAPATSYSSSESTVSRTNSSTQSFHQQDYSSTSPTEYGSTAPSRQGLSANTLSLARQVLLPEHEHLRHEKAVLLSGGLRWLLESSAEAEKNYQRAAPSHNLTEAAVRTFNRIEDGKKMFVVEHDNSLADPSAESANESRRTEDWILDSAR